MDIDNKKLPPEHWKNYSLEDIEGEIWKDVVGFEGLYEISNMGRMKSLSRRKRLINNRECWSKIRIKKPKIHNKKRGSMYIQIQLYDINGHRQFFSIHRLVATAFISNPENKPEVNHKNGIRWDNRVENLEWNTRKENARHAYDTGLAISLKGENCGRHKLTWNQVNEIRAKYIKNIYTSKMIAIEYNVTPSLIRSIIRNEIWKI